MNEKRRVVVTGMGVVSCFGIDVNVFFENLLQGKSGVKNIAKFSCEDIPVKIAANVADFDVERFVGGKQARRLDDYALHGIVAGKSAVADAFRDGVKFLDKSRCGVIMASGMGGVSTFYEGVKAFYSTNNYRKVSPFFIPYTITNICSGILAIETGFMGPNYSISTACASGSHAIISAAEHIRRGEVDVMLCGGSEAAVSPISVVGFICAKTLSLNNDDPQGASRPWDVDRDGFVMGEGAGCLVLESLEHAKARNATIYGEYLGGMMNCDAYHITSPRPDFQGIKQCVNLALKNANVAKERVNYINAHATSTKGGDLIEAQAIQQIFSSKNNVKMNSTKSMIGHCLGAAGAIEAIVVIKSLESNKIHPTINTTNVEDGIDFDLVMGSQYVNHDIDVAISNSFGFGGHNATLVFSKCM